jgi:hypothetical protein
VGVFSRLAVVAFPSKHRAAAGKLDAHGRAGVAGRSPPGRSHLKAARGEPGSRLSLRSQQGKRGGVRWSRRRPGPVILDPKVPPPFPPGPRTADPGRTSARNSAGERPRARFLGHPGTLEPLNATRPPNRRVGAGRGCSRFWTRQLGLSRSSRPKKKRPRGNTRGRPVSRPGRARPGCRRTGPRGPPFPCAA